MDIKDIDKCFYKFYDKDYFGNTIFSGDFLIQNFCFNSISNNVLYLDIICGSEMFTSIRRTKEHKFIDFKNLFYIAEYFKINENDISLFVHRNDSYYIAGNKNVKSSNLIRFPFNEVEKLKINLRFFNSFTKKAECTKSDKNNYLKMLKNNILLKNKKCIVLDNEIVINFSDTKIYRKYIKILKGITFRKNWKYEIPYIFFYQNNNYDKSCYIKYDYKHKNDESVEYYESFDEFYKKSAGDNRNLEIFCSPFKGSNHKEYFFKFKKD